MASENGQENIPDSWEQNMGDGSVSSAEVNNELGKSLSNLNVNAPAFVPGQNVFAAEFVPSGFSSNSAESGKNPWFFIEFSGVFRPYESLFGGEFDVWKNFSYVELRCR